MEPLPPLNVEKQVAQSILEPSERYNGTGSCRNQLSDRSCDLQWKHVAIANVCPHCEGVPGLNTLSTLFLVQSRKVSLLGLKKIRKVRDKDKEC